jgi:hypothetical protein
MQGKIPCLKQDGAELSRITSEVNEVVSRKGRISVCVHEVCGETRRPRLVL